MHGNRTARGSVSWLGKGIGAVPGLGHSGGVEAVSYAYRAIGLHSAWFHVPLIDCFISPVRYSLLFS